MWSSTGRSAPGPAGGRCSNSCINTPRTRITTAADRARRPPVLPAAASSTCVAATTSVLRRAVQRRGRGQSSCASPAGAPSFRAVGASVAQSSDAKRLAGLRTPGVQPAGPPPTFPLLRPSPSSCRRTSRMRHLRVTARGSLPAAAPLAERGGVAVEAAEVAPHEGRWAARRKRSGGQCHAVCEDGLGSSVAVERSPATLEELLARPPTAARMRLCTTSALRSAAMRPSPSVRPNADKSCAAVR
mmetsp:Transcript_21925/g.39096  ORF Transcript_21925/g.39096 Transcript_21925/m.39096 type:complete len:244 (+) Transcript_21925:595-1326(+)